MKRFVHLVCACVAVVALLAAVPSPATAAHRFGDGVAISPTGVSLRSPLAAVRFYADLQNNRCASRLSANRLAALMLSVTWYEAAGGDVTKTPSPMTMSRSDVDSDLYFNRAPGGPLQRAFWHPGIGMWQLDDQSLGTNAARGKFNAAFSASVIARDMAIRFCGSGGSMRAVFAPYFACGSGGSKCIATFRDIYTSDRLRDIVRDGSVDTTGGTRAFRTCRIGAQVVGCSYVNYRLAQGHTGSWVPDATGVSPLAYPYYVVTQLIGGQFYERRIWLTDDTPYSSTLTSRRAFGQDSRNGLRYTTSLRMCDLTAVPPRGDCP